MSGAGGVRVDRRAADTEVELEPLLSEGATEEEWFETFPIFDYTGGLPSDSDPSVANHE